jgi:alpha,alpha-trehalase
MPSPSAYPQLAGRLFEIAQEGRVFPDSKTFVDCVPVEEPGSIRERFTAEYEGEDGELDDVDGDLDLAGFVHENFTLPEDPVTAADPSTTSMEWYIDGLWPHLIRDPIDRREGETVIPLPNRSVIPGGRFRESYYWDSYFVAEGLAVTGRVDVVEDIVENFASLIDRFGFIPNGNRLYYTTRSNPPLYHRLLDLLAHRRGPEEVLEYLPALEREYEFWMDGADGLERGEAYRRVVGLEEGVLNRYWDDQPRPRPESYREDVELAERVDREPESVYRDVRAACESGWDFSSRWFDGEGIETIRTTDIVPVDLNAFLYGMERSLAGWHEYDGDDERAADYRERAAERRRLVDRYCWDAEREFYFDHSRSRGDRTDSWTLAGVVPLFSGAASQEQADAVAETLEERFLRSGGLVTSLRYSGEQWDAPNGWAPLQWMAIVGLRRYDHSGLAQEIAGRWLDLNREVFERTGRMLEKYDVTGGRGEGGGGEYPLQFGFGWTNGVALALPEFLY